MCGVKLMDKKSTIDQLKMFYLDEAMDMPAKADSFL